MKRQKRIGYAPQPYPSGDVGSTRRTVLQGGAALVGLALFPGCVVRQYGGMSLPLPDRWDVWLPQSPDSSTLYFDTGGTIDYRVLAGVDSGALADDLRRYEDELLSALAEQFRREDVTRFDPNEDLGELEGDAMAVLTATLQEQGVRSLGTVLEVTLYVDRYNPDDEVDGDMARPVR